MARSFLLAEIEALEPLAFVLAHPAAEPLHTVEVMRTEQGGLEVRIPGRPRALSDLSPRARAALAETGFTSKDVSDPTQPWVRPVTNPAAAVDLVQVILRDAFVWFDETLIGDQFGDDDLTFTIRVVATTADEWDDRLKQMFGGATYHEMLEGRSEEKAPPTKPGLGGYL